jgi:hypothetical protein
MFRQGPWTSEPTQLAVSQHTAFTVRAPCALDGEQIVCLTTEDDAKLIAMAPEMYEFIKRIAGESNGFTREAKRLVEFAEGLRRHVV